MHGGGDGEQAEGKINISKAAIIIQIPLYAMKLKRQLRHLDCVHTLSHLHTETKNKKMHKGVERIATERPGAETVDQTFRYPCSSLQPLCKGETT